MRWAALLVSIALFTPACNGGSDDQHALKNDSDTIDRSPARVPLLAHQVVDGATTEPFTRVHAGERATRASNFEDALSQRPTTPGIEQAVRKEAEKAGASRTFSTSSRRTTPTAPQSSRGVWSRKATAHEDLPDRARHPRGDRRLRRHRRPRLQRLRRSDLRIRAPLGRRDRRGRHQRVLGDVRTRRGDLAESRVRRRPRARGVLGRPHDADRRPDRELDDARGRDRRAGDLPPAALRTSVPLADPRRDRRRRPRRLDALIRLDRADLRLRGPLPSRLRGRGGQAASRLGSRRARLRPAHQYGTTPSSISTSPSGSSGPR